jgi:ribosomal protein S8E
MVGRRNEKVRGRRNSLGEDRPSPEGIGAEEELERMREKGIGKKQGVVYIEKGTVSSLASRP